MSVTYIFVPHFYFLESAPFPVNVKCISFPLVSAMPSRAGSVSLSLCDSPGSEGHCKSVGLSIIVRKIPLFFPLISEEVQVQRA